MIGRPVSSDELQKVLERRAAKDKSIEELKAEMRAIKPGECLLYESKKEMGTLVDWGFSLFISELGLKMITEGDLIYIYRE